MTAMRPLATPGPITEGAFAQLRLTRLADPEAVGRAFAVRRRRPVVRGDGRLLIVAADHPARGALGIRKDPMAMADRYDLLQRVATALACPGVDGVLGTPELIDDLALLGLLDDKIVVGSMNRGGLRGAAFEMDDRYTAYDIPAITRDRLDFAKALVRFDLDDPATVTTMEATARAVDAAAAAQVPIMLEPFLSRRVDGRIVNDLSTDAVINSIVMAAGLGGSSAYTWLKLPVVDDMADVMASTTLPTLLLGGDPAIGPDTVASSWESALALPGVVGLTVGRALLYPHDGDVAGAVAAAAELVHAAVER
ncbi:Cgl0159 family (beta/alpha)8-fold protein [Gordonia sp. FQ]|uniref:Cgl0159 family (beta/alpha)8-fold protein n=1 Tax=Gordonia sp. FQ TaxID=3446634 RepID=UPI003F8656F8